MNRSRVTMGSALEGKPSDDFRFCEEEAALSLSGVSVPPQSGSITSLGGQSSISSLSGHADRHSITSRSGLLDWHTITFPSKVPPPPPPCSSGTSVEWYSVASLSEIPPSTPPCSGTSLEWHIKSYTVGSRKRGKCKTILRDIGTRLYGPAR